uniref:Uncharacterized protein n=1 Tax=viral metagenome TaxID=1070528 RepID=A0A6C0EST9_9ZZZZ
MSKYKNEILKKSWKPIHYLKNENVCVQQLTFYKIVHFEI